MQQRFHVTVEVDVPERLGLVEFTPLADQLALLGGGHAGDVLVLVEQLAAFAVEVDLAHEDGRHADRPALRSQLADACIVEIARMVVCPARRGVREDDRRARQLQQLVEHRIGGVAAIDHHAQPVHLSHPLPAERTQTVPFDLAGGRIRQLVGRGMDRARHPHAAIVELLQQAHILAQRIAVLDRLERDQLALGRQPLRFGDGGGGADEIGKLREFAVDRVRPGACKGQRVGIALGGQRTLFGIDDEEAAIEIALCHPTEIDLRDVVNFGMRL